ARGRFGVRGQARYRPAAPSSPAATARAAGPACAARQPRAQCPGPGLQPGADGPAADAAGRGTPGRSWPGAAGEPEPVITSARRRLGVRYHTGAVVCGYGRVEKRGGRSVIRTLIADRMALIRAG